LHRIDFITEFLLKNEIMDDEQFVEAMKPDATMEQVEALVTEKKRRSEEENKRRALEIENAKKEAEEERRRLERELGLSDDNTPENEKADDDMPQIDNEKTDVSPASEPEVTLPPQETEQKDQNSSEQ
jgi:hypothetical protein